ncbi:MAG: TonB-dependent receptor, partial [Gemmatimonadaceae bacterium]
MFKTFRRGYAWSAAALGLLGGIAPPVAAQNTAIITATVRNAATGLPLADATIRALPAGRSCVTAGDGTCRLVVNAGQVDLRATALGVAPASKSIRVNSGASTGVAFALQPSAMPLDEVVTVGSRSLDRTKSQSTVPVDVVSSQLLENTGLPEPWQQLQQFIPSVNVPHIPIGDNHMRPVTLRGLAPHHVLVLVNGKRRHPASALLAGPSVPNTSMTDIGAIPSSAIDRIEILRDGAAAQYGSDAIGGVVNIILKSGERRELQAMAGTVLSSEGGRDFRDGRMFSASGTFGAAPDNGGHLTLSAEVRAREGTNRAYPDRRQQYFTGNPGNEAEPRISNHHGNGEGRALLLVLSAGKPLGSNSELYAFGSAGGRNGVTPDAFFRRPSDNGTVRAIHPDGFLPEVVSDILDMSAVAGARGTLRGWRWDVSSSLGGHSVDYTVRNSNNASLGAASPTRFEAGRVATQQWTSNTDVSRDLKIGSLPVSIAGGLEYRVGKYQVRAGDEDSWRDGDVRILDGPAKGQRAAAGAQGMVGYRPLDEVSAHRSSSAIYLEAESRPVERLLLQTAARAEHYSDFGSTTDGKIAARMQLIRGLAARGSLSTGFRAPALAQQYSSNSRTVFRLVNGVLTVLTTRTFPVNTPEAQLLGATPLRPETSVNGSAGLAFDRPRFPVITADVYQITIDDRIGLGSTVSDTSIIRMFEQNGMSGLGGGSYFRNLRDTRTRGLDVVASQAFLVGRGGVFRIVGGYNHNKTVMTRTLPAPPELVRFATSFSNRTSRGIFERGQPRQTINLTLNYGSGPLGLNLHNRRAGPTAQLDQTNPDADQIVDPKWVTDARISYKLRQRIEVSLSAANLFDVYPNEWFDFKDGAQAQGPSIGGIFRYPAALAQSGMNGR